MKLEISTFRCPDCLLLVDAVLGPVEPGSDMDEIVKRHMGDHLLICRSHQAP